MQARPIHLAVMLGVGLAAGLFTWAQNAALDKAMKAGAPQPEASSRPSPAPTVAKRTPLPTPPANAVSRADSPPASPVQPSHVRRTAEIALPRREERATALAPEGPPASPPPLTAEEARVLREAMAQLSSKDDWQRKKGIWRLKALKEKAAPAIPNLIAQLGSKGGENERKEYGVIRLRFTLPDRIVDRSPGWQAGEALVAIGPAAVPALTRAFQTATPYGQQNAAEALSKLRGARALPLFHAVLQEQLSLSRTAALEPDREELRRMLIRFLAEMKDQEAAEWLVACLRHDPSCSIRAEAARLLASLDARSAVPALQEAARDRERTVRSAVYGALAKLAGPEALVSELAVAKDPDAALQFCSAADKNSIPVLIALLRHRESVVRLSAAGALGRLRDPGSVPVLLARLADADADDDDRISLCQVLGEFRDARSTPSLLALLGAPNAKVRQAAAYALGWPDNREALPPLARLALRDPDSQVRIAALSSVGRLNVSHEHAAALFDAALGDRDPAVRKAAKLQLALLPRQARATRP